MYVKRFLHQELLSRYLTQTYQWLLPKLKFDKNRYMEVFMENLEPRKQPATEPTNLEPEQSFVDEELNEDELEQVNGGTDPTSKGKGKLSGFSFTRKIDKSSPNFFIH